MRVSKDHPHGTPNPVKWHNYVDAWNALPFSHFLANTLFIKILIMLGNIITSAVVGYGFVRYRFPGRDVLFIVHYIDRPERLTNKRGSQRYVISPAALPDQPCTAPQSAFRLGMLQRIQPFGDPP